MSQDIVQLITQIAQQHGADPAAMLATARVESGLNPRAVGDGGTSFGLYQHHIGGAGGRTRESAQRYFDPVASITERAKQFARLGIRGGKGAAALQRPADPSGYARKVDAALRGAGASLNAPVSASNAPAASAPGAGSGNREAAIGMLFADDPAFTSFLSLAGRGEAPASPRPVQQQQSPTQPTGRPTANGWQQLQQIAQKRFGLRNDPGNSQTFGGRHSQGSEHYDGRAIDFGTARNSRAQLNAWLKWARGQGYDAIDEGDHVHVSLPGSGI